MLGLGQEGGDPDPPINNIVFSHQINIISYISLICIFSRASQRYNYNKPNMFGLCTKHAWFVIVLGLFLSTFNIMDK